MSQDEIIKICAIEAHYWGEVEDERMINYSIGAMGAAANICSAIMRELTPDQFREEIKQRSPAAGGNRQEPQR